MAQVELPDGITEEQGKQWVARLYASYRKQLIESDPAHVAKVQEANADIDKYLVKVGLKPAEAEPVIEPKEK